MALPKDAHPSISKESYSYRIRQGWDPTKAKFMPSRQDKKPAFPDIPRGRSWAFKLPADWENDFEVEVAFSGMTISDFVAVAIGEKLGKIDD